MQIKGDAQYQMMMMASKGYMHPAMYAAAAAHPQAAMHPAFAAMAGVPKGAPLLRIVFNLGIFLFGP